MQLRSTENQVEGTYQCFVVVEDVKELLFTLGVSEQGVQGAGTVCRTYYDTRTERSEVYRAGINF